MKIRVLDDRILVEVDAEAKVSPSGIAFPDKSLPLQDLGKGKVVSVGPGRLLGTGERRRMETREGQRVLFHRNVGESLPIAGKNYRVMRDHDVIAVEE